MFASGSADGKVALPQREHVSRIANDRAVPAGQSFDRELQGVDAVADASGFEMQMHQLR
jgi:hypothetical protein